MQELDLSYAILPWSSREERQGAGGNFGDKVGYRYYEDEDCGLFWSNDPHLTIRQMYGKLGLMEEQEEYQRTRKFTAKQGL